MALSKTVLFILLISVFILDLVHAHDQSLNRYGYGHKIHCGVACKARCRLASRHKICVRACGTCCRRCRCVPPGTSGNQDFCPCYAALTTHGGRRKCP